MNNAGFLGESVMFDLDSDKRRGCQRRLPHEPVYCAVAGIEVTVATARMQYHYRGGKLTGDVPVTNPRHTAPTRPENRAQCSSCGNCTD